VISEPQDESMKLRYRTTWYLVLALVAVAVAATRTARPPLWESPVRAAEQQDEQKPGKLPPLTIDADSPLMLDEAKKQAKDDKPVAPSVAENAACFVCHDNFQDEELVTQHAIGDTGCVDCHGKSYDHRNDENNITPPDVMFPRDKIEASCVECHDTHDAPALDVIARLDEHMPRVTDRRDITCTDCHGHHRLGQRTVVWDRATRELLTGKQDAPAKKTVPTIDSLKALVGTWVRADEHGQPTDQVVSTYRVTAAGTAVVEVVFPGTDREMMTVYHQDGDDLMLTHYCAAGNQPRMKCRAGSDPNQLVFEFVDATNMRSMRDRHMHAGTLTIVDPRHIQATWQGYAEGAPAEAVTFDLVRRAE
jgi:hypothetical protein